jgi:hypothetical protein
MVADMLKIIFLIASYYLTVHNCLFVWFFCCVCLILFSNNAHFKTVIFSKCLLYLNTFTVEKKVLPLK